MIVCTKLIVEEVREVDGVTEIVRARPLEVSFGCGGHEPVEVVEVGDMVYLTTRTRTDGRSFSRLGAGPREVGFG